MEKITLQQQEISAWKDHFQTETYSTLLNKSMQTHPLKNNQPKKETISSKTSKHQHHRLLSKYSLNFRETTNLTKNYRKHKLGETDILVKNKKTLLQYLETETSKLQSKTQKRSLESISKIHTLKQPFLSYKSSMTENDQVMLYHTSLQSPIDNQTFKEIFWNGTTQKKHKKKRFFLNAKKTDQKNEEDKNKCRSRQCTNFLNRSYLKKQNMSQLYGQERIVEKIDFNRHKIKQFPLYFREILQREQQWSKRGERGKQRFKVHKKTYKSEMQFTYVDKEVVLGQFLDNNLFNKNMRI